MHDVIVIGAGPAGLMAAGVLASAGRAVVVLEEHASVGQPVHCTGVLGAEAFDEMDVLPRGAILGAAGTARFTAPDGTSVRIDAGRTLATIIDRGALDSKLAVWATRAGADVRTSARVRAIESDARRVRVQVGGSGQWIAARACVIACGAAYQFHRRLGFGIPRVFASSMQAEVPIQAADGIEVYLGSVVAPGGFAWVVPFQRSGATFARVGLTCASRARQYFDRLLRVIARSQGVDLAAPSPRAKMLPLGPVRKTYANRILAVGDAAGLVKPTTGGGIYYSLLTGRLAAQVLDEQLHADDLSETALRRYEDRWRDRLGGEIRIGLAFRAVASRLNDRAINAIVELGRNDGIAPLLKRTADFNWHGDAALALLRHAGFRRAVLASLW